MNADHVPAIKICCLTSLADARLALAAGAEALGFISETVGGPRVIADASIAAITAALPPTVETCLLTALDRADGIAAQHARVGTTTIQLVDRLAPGELARLRERLPDVRLVQVVHVLDHATVDEAVAAAPWVDAILLDSGDPRGAVKVFGGTGRTHDWAISRVIRDTVPRPVWLAGGLHPGNVAAAVAAVAPRGLDVCSGVRTGGRLDPARLEAFFAAARGTGTARTPA